MTRVPSTKPRLRPRFHAPEYDPREGNWCVVVVRPLVTGQWQRTRHWYADRGDAWWFIESACTQLRGEVTA